MALFDVTDSGDGGFGVIPEGIYSVYLDEAKLKDNKAGTGTYINCKFVITEGKYAERVLFHIFNLTNPNPAAVKIGREQIKAFMKASGLTTFAVNSVSELVGLKCLAVVKIKTDSYGEKNNISYFKPILNSSETPKGPQTEVEGVPF